jgi:thioredoxin reductase (NADPH)
VPYLDYTAHISGPIARVHTFSQVPDDLPLSIATPTLSDDMIRRLHDYGMEETTPSSAMLFRRGERAVDLFIVLGGRLEIFQQKPQGIDTIMVTLTNGQFTGELDLLSGRVVLLSCRAGKVSRVLRIGHKSLRLLMRTELDVADLVMRAWMRRRTALVRDAQGGVILIGPSSTGDTSRLQQFMTRNRYPFKLIETDTNPDAQLLLSCLEIAANELPVVFLPDHRVLRNPTNSLLADQLGMNEALDERTDV